MTNEELRMCRKFKDCKYTAFVGNEHDIAQLGLFGMLGITEMKNGID